MPIMKHKEIPDQERRTSATPALRLFRYLRRKVRQHTDHKCTIPPDIASNHHLPYLQQKAELGDEPRRMDELEEQGFPHELNHEGQILEVESTQGVPRARQELADEGWLKELPA